MFVHGKGNKKSTQAFLSMNIIIQSCIYIGADSYNICVYTMSVLLTLLFPVLLLASKLGCHLVICQ